MASLPSDTGSTSRKRSCTELDDENYDNDRLDRHYDMWLVVQSVDSDHLISKLYRFFLSKTIKSAVRTVTTLRRLRNGDFLLEVSSAVQSRIVNKLYNLALCPVTASPHRTLNTCKGVIRCAPLVDQGRNYFRAETPRGFRHNEHLRQRRLLWQKKYKHVHRYLQSTNHSKTPSCWILESSCINIYIPNPPRCFKCQKFGHGKNACRGRETCATCAGQVGHSNNNCTNEAKCRTVLAVSLPSAKAALNGSLRKGFRK